ncbi:MAG: hypothetical protein HFJ91_10735 [Muribaculaceae bacterium]|nr:hypothetical protein [Muribaculaceae bacterium]
MNNAVKNISAAALCLLLPAVALADDVDEAVRAAKDAPRNQGLNRAAGDALRKAGRYAESIPFYMKGGNAGNLGAAESSFYMYRFDDAREYLDKYLAKRSKAEEAKDMEYTSSSTSEPTDWTEVLGDKISLGAAMLDRVEKIEIIDSINVPSEEFYTFIRLARSAGSLASSEIVEQTLTPAGITPAGIDDIMNPAYMTESGDDIIWVGSDNDGNSKIVETFRLADGTWDKPVSLFDHKTIFGESEGSWVDYPFLLSDGVTLYFAADGDESLGGLDIFMTRRDEDGFLQPSNIGMPYNSPFNDYLYAIDEETGTGWWVTDRNGLADSVTIYTFIPSEMRVNYPVDTPDLISMARVSSVSSTRIPGKDYSDIIRKIYAIDEMRRSGIRHDFDFALPDGRIVHRLSDFHSNMARNAMQKYLEEKKSVAALAKNLSDMRARYGQGDTSLANDILNTEKELESRRAELVGLSNQVISLEL